ncbi:MAG: succinate dehydrogenase, cytochrome b556 subunit [Rhodospirillaceae bacterium]|nr:succinate dehydrogenase, cytochrome b556 subunit [Rhodospirillaceae bacterium]
MPPSAKATARPLSPHVQVYRLPLTALLSITHRITGVGLALGLVLLAWWLAAAATGPDAYATASAVIGSWFGLLVLFGFSFALSFHLCNGVRHLFWDAGKGFEIAQAQRSDKIVIAAAIALTAVAWLAAV